jgi:hypothetical protein
VAESILSTIGRVLARLAILQESVSWFLLAVLVVQAVVFILLVYLAFLSLVRTATEAPADETDSVDAPRR